MPKKGSKNSKMQGGAGAADYAIAVYGNTNDHRAIPGSNVIAAKLVGGRGRKQKQQQQQEQQQQEQKQQEQQQEQSQGGNIIADIAVPAILITGNQLYKRKRTNKKYRKSQKSRKNRRSTYRRR